ncbi:MAG TPA: hypothetical protein VGE76_14880, partial [Opitutaceae bacterium]
MLQRVWQCAAGLWVRRSKRLALCSAVLALGPVSLVAAENREPPRESAGAGSGPVEFDLPSQTASDALIAFSK